MSRRQRKNVKKRGKDSEPSSNPTNVCAQDPNATKNQKKRNSLPSKFYLSLGLSDDQIYYHLLNYILDQDTLRSLGLYILFKKIYSLNNVEMPRINILNNDYYIFQDFLWSLSYHLVKLGFIKILNFAAELTTLYLTTNKLLNLAV